MSMNKTAVFLFIVWLSCVTITKVFAMNYFTFSADRNLILQGEEMTIKFNHKLEGYEEKDFIVRPIFTNGKVEIYNQDNDSWISQADLWTKMPFLQSSMRLRPVFNGSSDLWFKIQNTEDAKIYETPKLTVWGKGAYFGYISQINKNIKMYVLRQEASAKVQIDKKDAVENKQKTAGLLAKVIKYIGEII